MPQIFKPGNESFNLGPYNKSPFGLLTRQPGLSRESEAKHLVYDVRKLPPGEFSFPYHYHRSAEEVMYIISGGMTLRTADGFAPVGEGDVIAFETGESGAHQFYNHTGEPCTYLDVKTYYDLDVVVYPDSGKVMVSRYNEVFERESQVGYFDREDKVREVWARGGFATRETVSET